MYFQISNTLLMYKSLKHIFIHACMYLNLYHRVLINEFRFILSKFLDCQKVTSLSVNEEDLNQKVIKSVHPVGGIQLAIVLNIVTPESNRSYCL